MEVLLFVGFLIFIGTLGGKVFQRLKIPQVTGYIVVGLILGPTGLHFVTSETIDLFGPFVDLALGIIGLLIGAELKFDVFRNRGRSIYSILICEGLVTFLLVTVCIYFVTGEVYYGLLLGAIAAATAPAATVDVLWEYKARGPLTSTLLAIVALDDVLALLIYAFAGLVARGFILHEEFSFGHSVHAIAEIGLGSAIGIAGGLMLFWLIHFIKDRDRILPFSFGAIAIAVGAAAHFKIDLILSSILMGFTLANISPRESGEIFDTIKQVSAPIYVLFFVLVGARMDASYLFIPGIAVMAIVYFFSRSIGKVGGSYLGGIVGRAPPAVTRYLGMCMFSQAGVAIGLAISIHNNLSHYGPEVNQIGLNIINVVVGTTFVVQIIGPLFVRLGIKKAGEMWKDVTEEDVIQSYKVADLIEKNIPVIPEKMPLNKLVDSMKNSESYDFCVVDATNRLLGSISIGDLRDVLLEQKQELHHLVLAKDIAVPPTRVISASAPLKDAIEILKRKDLNFLPVVKDEKTRELVGLIHYRHVMAQVQKELLARRGN